MAIYARTHAHARICTYIRVRRRVDVEQHEGSVVGQHAAAFLVERRELVVVPLVHDGPRRNVLMLLFSFFFLFLFFFSFVVVVVAVVRSRVGGTHAGGALATETVDFYATTPRSAAAINAATAAATAASSSSAFISPAAATAHVPTTSPHNVTAAGGEQACESVLRGQHWETAVAHERGGAGVRVGPAGHRSPWVATEAEEAAVAWSHGRVLGERAAGYLDGGGAGEAQRV